MNNNDLITKHRGMALYLCHFEFTSGEYGQNFNLLFYARNTKSLKRKVDRYLRDYLPRWSLRSRRRQVSLLGMRSNG